MFRKTKSSDSDSGSPIAHESTGSASRPPAMETASVSIDRSQGGDAGASRRVRPVYERLQTNRTSGAAQAATPEAEAQGARLHVGPGLKLEGKIEDCELLMVEGGVEATIEAKSFKIGKTGKVKGTAQVGEAEIHGIFEGDLTVQGCLGVGATGSISGTIIYGELAIERGGRLLGTVTLDDKTANAGKRGGAHTFKSFRAPGGAGAEADEDKKPRAGARRAYGSGDSSS